jgi:putative PIN family toxin of toxin-antitoxin system
MKTNDRFVFDTNVLISALLFSDSIPGKAFTKGLGSGKILISPATILELQDVLSRKKFTKYVLPEERERFVASLARESVVVQIANHIHACRDPKDDKFLELAVSGKASCIISGDPHLLELSPFQKILIITPAEFLII